MKINFDFSWVLTRPNALLLCVILLLTSSVFNWAIRGKHEEKCRKKHPSKKHKEVFPYFKNNWIKKRFLIGFNGLVGSGEFIICFIETVLMLSVIALTLLYLIFYIEIMSHLIRIISLIDLILIGFRSVLYRAGII